MKRIIAFTVISLALLSVAQAHPRYHHYRHYAHARHVRGAGAIASLGGGMAHQLDSARMWFPNLFQVAPQQGWPTQPAPRAVEEIFHGGIVTVQTAAGVPIHVAAGLAGRFQSLVQDFVAAGYRPRSIGCFARGGHVQNSRHYAGAACDFDQTGWGRTVGFIYRAHSIIVAHGFRDGCDFRDCGHVDDGVNIGAGSRHAARHRRRYAAAR